MLIAPFPDLCLLVPFATPMGGLYQFKTMPFGLCNSPATFQRIAEKALVGLLWSIAVLYLDDIIVLHLMIIFVI